RKRFFSVIKKLFLINPQEKANQFFIDTISKECSDINFKKNILYIEVCRKNDLFFDITINLIKKKYKENRRLISSSEIFDFLGNHGQGTKLEEWSDITIKKISSKYNTFMRKLGYFQKENRQKSSFNFPYPDKKIITYIVYLLKIAQKVDNEVYNSKLFQAFMLTEEKKIDVLKKGSLAGYYDFSLSGNKNAIFELNYPEEEIIDELFAKKP
ncbi:MAG: BrxA family protein, partial [Halanaerobiales bacterium]